MYIYSQDRIAKPNQAHCHNRDTHHAIKNAHKYAAYHYLKNMKAASGNPGQFHCAMVYLMYSPQYSPSVHQSVKPIFDKIEKDEHNNKLNKYWGIGQNMKAVAF